MILEYNTYRSTGTDTLSVVALSQETVDTTNGELKTGLGRTGLGLGRSLTTSLTTRFATGRHCCKSCVWGVWLRENG